MRNPFLTRYRVNRGVYPSYWMVQAKRWWWPFWVGERDFLLSAQDAFELKKILEDQS